MGEPFPESIERLPDAMLRYKAQESWQAAGSMMEALDVWLAGPPTQASLREPIEDRIGRAANTLVASGVLPPELTPMRIVEFILTAIDKRSIESIRRQVEHIKVTLETAPLVALGPPAVAPSPNGEPRENEAALAGPVRAILFLQETLKRTGKLPPKVKIAEALGVDRRTLCNWRAFKVAYARMKRQHAPPPKGTKSKDGTLEAWRERGK